MEPQRRLYRSERNRMLAGVCAGLGDFFGIDPTLVRVVFVILLFTGFGLLLYVIMWLLVPRESKLAEDPATVARDAVDELRDQAKRGAEELRGAYERWREPPDQESPEQQPPERDEEG